MFDATRSALTAVAVGLLLLRGASVVMAQPSGESSAEAAPGVPVGAAPMSAAGVDTNFVSATGMAWEVMVDQQSACVTPCRLLLARPSWITMRTRERSPLRLEVGSLGAVPTLVTAHDLQHGKYATGIVFTSFGGMALVVGITLGAVGYGAEREGMKTAGLITGASGAAMTLGGIYLMRSALPRTYVRVLEQRGLALAPTANGGVLSGRF